MSRIINTSQSVDKKRFDANIEHIFGKKKLWTNDYDTFVAKGPDHLRKLFGEHLGVKNFQFNEDEEFYRIPDEEIRSISYEEDSIPDGLHKDLRWISIEPKADYGRFTTVRARALDWAEWAEPGFLCSTES